MAEATAPLPEGTTRNPARGALTTIRDVDAIYADIAQTAAVSLDAFVGQPGEWRTEPTRFPALIEANAIVREAARIHAGCKRETIIGERTLIMAGAHIGHDTHLGEDCEVAPNAVVGGCCTIGNRVRIGMGAVINPDTTIGDDVRIGSGAVVLDDIEPGQTWVGNPARRIR